MNGQLCILAKDLAHYYLGPEHDNGASATSRRLTASDRAGLRRHCEVALRDQLALQGYAEEGARVDSFTVEVRGGDREWTLIDCWKPGQPIERVFVTVWFDDRAVYVDSGAGTVAVEALEDVEGRDEA